MLTALTSREIEVVRYAADGLNTKETARAMEISPRTVEMFCSSAKAKLGGRTRAHTIALAIRQGLVGGGRGPAETDVSWHTKVAERQPLKGRVDPVLRRARLLAGREYRAGSCPRRAILTGQWDGGRVVGKYLGSSSDA